MNIGVGGLAAMVDQTSSSAANSRANALKDTLGKDMSSATDEELMDVCKEFETYFVEMVMKEVEKTMESAEEDSSSSQYVDLYKDQVRTQLAETICEQTDLGLAQQMYEQMKRNYSL